MQQGVRSRNTDFDQITRQTLGDSPAVLISIHKRQQYRLSAGMAVRQKCSGMGALFVYHFVPERGLFLFMRYDAFMKCHPLTNFLFFVGAIGFSVVIQHPLYLAVSWLGAAVYYVLLNGKKSWKLLAAQIPVFIFVSAINPLFNTYGETVLFTVFGEPYTLEALYYGMVIAGMLVAMTLWFGCYSAVLTSDKFVCLFGSLIPAISLLLVMVLRMLPNLMRRAKQLAGVRKSIGKGAGEQSSRKEKIADGMNVLSALTDWALEGSIVTADSMRARGYGAAKRTSFLIYRMTLRDIVLILWMLFLAAAVLFFGGTTATFTPEFYIAPPTWGLAAYCVFLMIPSVLHIQEAYLWHISISRI